MRPPHRSKGCWLPCMMRRGCRSHRFVDKAASPRRLGMKHRLTPKTRKPQHMLRSSPGRIGSATSTTWLAASSPPSKSRRCWPIHGCVGKAVTPRCLGVMLRMMPSSPSSRAPHYVGCRPEPRSSMNVCNVRTPHRRAERQRTWCTRRETHSPKTVNPRLGFLGKAVSPSSSYGRRRHKPSAVTTQACWRGCYPSSVLAWLLPFVAQAPPAQAKRHPRTHAANMITPFAWLCCDRDWAEPGRTWTRRATWPQQVKEICNENKMPENSRRGQPVSLALKLLS